jgi:hypothetical protein
MTPQTPRKATLRQVASTVLFALLMIGKKEPRAADGAPVTIAQVFVGALIGFILLIAGLVALVNLIAR